MSTEIVEALEKAKAVIQERGWTKGVLADADTGCVCAIGALNVAVFDTPTPYAGLNYGAEAEQRYSTLRPGQRIVDVAAALITDSVSPEKLPMEQFDRWDKEKSAYVTVEEPARYFEVPDFNDAPDTTLEDVLAAIDAAIEKAKANA